MEKILNKYLHYFRTTHLLMIFFLNSCPMLRHYSPQFHDFLSLRYAALSLLAHAAVCKRSWQPPRFPDNDTSSAFCRACNEG